MFADRIGINFTCPPEGIGRLPGSSAEDHSSLSGRGDKREKKTRYPVLLVASRSTTRCREQSELVGFSLHVSDDSPIIFSLIYLRGADVGVSLSLSLTRRIRLSPRRRTIVDSPRKNPAVRQY